MLLKILFKFGYYIYKKQENSFQTVLLHNIFTVIY